MNDQYTVITVDVAEQVGVIKINRPRQLNAINSTVMSELTQAMSELTERNDVSAIILGAEGRGP